MTDLTAPVRRRLEKVLEVARDRGALGPGPVGRHVEHSLALATIVGHSPTAMVDLGSGGGVPGLVLALGWPDARVVLVDSMVKRCAWLREAAIELGLTNCVVVEDRAERVARSPEHRAAYDLVVARAFGPPAVTAECAAPLLGIGGRLLVSEPPQDGGRSDEGRSDEWPHDRGRWPAERLAELGLSGATLTSTGQTTAAILVKEGPTADRWPRRAPAKRPLW